MSEINIQQLVTNVLSQVKQELLLVIPSVTGEALDAVNKYIDNLESRASALLTSLQQNNDAKFLIARLKDEKTILESEVFSFIIIGESLAQLAVNNIQDILIAAVETVLP